MIQPTPGSIAADLMAEQAPPVAKAKPRHNGSRNATVRPFDAVNAIDTVEVLDALGVAHEKVGEKELATCPGCGEPGALICKDGGCKCLHNRCSDAGPTSAPGFRSNVDLVMVSRGLDRDGALEWLAAGWGIELPPRSEKQNVAPEDPGPHEDWNPTDDDDPRRPPSEERAKVETRDGVFVPVASTARTASTIASVLTAWGNEGPLVHEPTGLVTLDQLTGGGPVYGTRWFLTGAPDAGKTLLLLHIAAIYAGRGIAVGLLAIDEEPGDLVTRLAQRLGYPRWRCEARAPADLEELGSALSSLPIRFYDSEWTIEAAAEDLSAWATAEGRRAFFGVDSLQTASCDADQRARSVGRDLSETSAVAARAYAMRSAASRHRLIAIGTSEMNRGSYSGPEASRTATLGSSKWSGAVEYQARVLIGLRSVAGESDLIDLDLAKNKHGPQARDGDPTTGHVFLRIDRRSQSLAEATYAPPPPEVVAAERQASKRDRVRSEHEAEREAILSVLPEAPEHMSSGELDSRLRALGIVKGHKTLAGLLQVLAADGLVIDTSDGRKSTARQWARKGTP